MTMSRLAYLCRRGRLRYVGGNSMTMNCLTLPALICGWLMAGAGSPLAAETPALPVSRQTAGPVTTPGARPELRKLNLQSAVETSLKNSPALKSAAQQVLKARGALNASRTVFLPTLSAEATLTHLDQGVTAQLGADPSQAITVVKQDQKSATLTAALPLDVAGMLKAASSLAEFRYLIARLDFNRQRNQLVQDVTVAYYDVLRAKEFVGVADQAMSNAADRGRIAEAYLKASTGTKFDVVRAQTEVANANQTAISARNRLALATAALNNLLGLDQATPLDLDAAGAAHRSPQGDGPAPPSLDDVLKEAYRVRPEVLQAEAGIRAASKGYYLASRSQAPGVALAWNWQYTPDTGAFGRKSSWAAVARATLPIFDGGAGAAARQQAQAEVETARNGLRQAMDGIALDVRQAHLSLQESRDRLRVAAAAMAQAEEAYRLAQVRFKAGVTLTPGGSPLLEISDAQTALTQAQTNQINAQYDVEVAATKLNRAAGRYAYDASATPGLDAPPSGDNK